MNVGVRGGQGHRPDPGHPRPVPEPARWPTGSSATSRAATSTRGTPASSSARGSSATSCSRRARGPSSSSSPTLKQEMARLLPELPPEAGGTIAGGLQGAEDPVRVRGVRRRPAAGHPGRLHHLPRLLRRPGHQERPPRRRHHGRGPDQQPDRRATGRRATRGAMAEWPSGRAGRVASRRPSPLRSGPSPRLPLLDPLGHRPLSLEPLARYRGPSPCPRSPSSSPARGRKPWAWAGSSTRSCPRPAPCSTARARSSASTCRRLCFEGPADALEATDVSQPAIFVASLAALEGLKASHPEVVAACSGAAGPEPGRIHGPGLRRGARLRDRPAGRPPPRRGDAGRGPGRPPAA